MQTLRMLEIAASASISAHDRDGVIGVDGRPGMLFQFTHGVPSVVRRFPWEEKNSHLRNRARRSLS
jgi:hypothetical protein